MYKFSKKLLILFIFLLFISSYKAQKYRVDQTKVDSVLQFCQSTGANAVLLYHDEKDLLKWKDPNCDQKMNTASMVKSWTGLVVGALVDRGLINIDDPVCNYLPEWKSGRDSSVTVENLLTMTSGLLKKPAPQSILAQKDMNKFVLNLDLDTTPGTQWSYSNEGVQLLGLIIERVSGLNAQEAFKKYLFKPLEMDSSYLYQDEAGNFIVFGGTSTTVEDALKIGILMLNEGMYKGSQILSENWVKKSVSPGSISKHYGYLWWLDKSNNNFAAMGDFGQMTVVFPDEKLVFVRQQSCSNNNQSTNMNWMSPEFLLLLKQCVIVK
ncbi:MAG: beta-lactamase family protein [Melioribacteraceae bacterium]|nr:beta-lactamase family protein [Melioribacteraceae bacterium]